MRRPGTAAARQPDRLGVAGREDEVRAPPAPSAPAKVATARGVSGGVVLLVVELEQRLGVERRRRAIRAARSSSSMHRVGDRGAGVVAQVEGPERRRRGVARTGPRAGGLAVEGQVVQDGEAVVGVDDEVDLDAGAERHALEDAAAGEDRVGGAAAARGAT